MADKATTQHPREFAFNVTDWASSEQDAFAKIGNINSFVETYINSRVFTEANKVERVYIVFRAKVIAICPK